MIATSRRSDPRSCGRAICGRRACGRLTIRRAIRGRTVRCVLIASLASQENVEPQAVGAFSRDRDRGKLSNANFCKTPFLQRGQWGGYESQWWGARFSSPPPQCGARLRSDPRTVRVMPSKGGPCRESSTDTGHSSGSGRGKRRARGTYSGSGDRSRGDRGCRSRGGWSPGRRNRDVFERGEAGRGATWAAARACSPPAVETEPGEDGCSRLRVTARTCGGFRRELADETGIDVVPRSTARSRWRSHRDDAANARLQIEFPQ